MININIVPPSQPTIKDLLRQIDRLQKSEAVMIAEKELQVRGDLEARITALKALEKRGMEIIAAGVDAEFLRGMIGGTEFGC